MKKILIFISLLLTYVSQGQISDAKITDTIALWIVPNLTKSITAAQMNAILDHLNNSKINKDSIVNVRTNAAEDTLFIKYKTTSDTIVLLHELDNLSDVTLTTPDASDMLILDDETMKWVNRPLIQVYDSMQHEAATAPTPYATWKRDATNEQLEVANETDKIKELMTKERTSGGLVTFSFDDGSTTDFSRMLPLFNAKGVPAISFITIDWVGGSGYMNWAQIIALQSAGWEIGSHTINHVFSDTTYNAMLDIAQRSKDSLKSHGISVRNMAYPGNTYNDSAMIAARNYFRSARSSFSIGDTLNHDVLKTYALKSFAADNPADSSTYYQLIRNADNKNQWLILYIHATDRADSVLFANMIDTIQARGMSIVTVNQALDLIGNQVDISDGFAVNNWDIKIRGRIFKGLSTTYDKALYIHAYQATGSDGFNQFMGIYSGNETMSPAGGAVSLASYNSGFGYKTLTVNTTGYGNTAVGCQTLWKNTTGYANTAVGRAAISNTVDGYRNTAIGYQAGSQNVSGDDNCYNGYNAGYYHTGNGNTFNGSEAGLGASGLSTTNNATGVGYQALYSIRDGLLNTALGYQAAYTLTSATGNTAVGASALRANATGNANTAVGQWAGFNWTGAANSFFGAAVAQGAAGTSTGTYNAGFGYETMNKSTGADFNTAFGSRALYTNTTGDNNTTIGYQGLYLNTTGSNNISLGYRSGYNETGSNKFYIASDSTSWANGMASGSKLLMYADQSNAAKSNHFMNIFAKVSIGAAKNPNEMLSVTGNASITGYLKSGTGSIADNDSTPSVASYNTFIYAGSANAVSIDALDDHVVGCYYTIIGNSNTYTITVIDGTPAGGDSFNLAGGNWVGGSQDVLLLYCIAADAFIEVSRSDN